MDTPDHLNVIANTFNLCIVLIARFGSITVLPLYSNMDCIAEMLFIGFILEQKHFIHLLLRDGCPLPPIQSLSLSFTFKSNRAWGGIAGAIVNAKVPRAIVPPQKYSAPCISYYLAACMPHESCMVSIIPRHLSSNLVSVRCPAVYFHSYNPTWDTAGCIACKLQYPV
ncbi:hypothetical protein M9H77_21376 [Catharanthus roseus]|uniref:Uncharacterized protein n=1 Tax=Catharanthus roseus TaxID=4058 RepID=A0ACC0AM80_CATRO|nr:hypothetical protein M9H77_21376 [Catharanthus roseus]